MGYSTNYEGNLAISPELKASDIAYLKKFLGEDIREDIGWPVTKEHKEFKDSYQCYLNIDFTPDYENLKWDESEKTNNMAEQINYVISIMIERLPDFKLTGEMHAQGEEIGDLYNITKDSGGFFSNKQLQVEGDIIVCPHCEVNFVLKPEHRLND